MISEMQYCIISLVYEVEVGGDPTYPMTQWQNKIRLYRSDNAGLFSNLAKAVETAGRYCPDTQKVVDDLIYGISTIDYTLVSSGPYMDHCLGSNARLLVVSHTLDGCVEDNF